MKKQQQKQLAGIAINFLDRVSTTGIQEANDLVVVFNFLEQLQKDELKVVENERDTGKD